MTRENIEVFPQHPKLFETPSVHFEMLHDTRRVETYQRAIEKTVKPGDVVVDIGTGTGLLAMLAVRAGASKVYAIEESEIIETAKEIAERNGLADKITFIKENSRKASLPERADVVISELIGHLAFEEGIARSLLDAKKRFLKPGGIMIPNLVVLQSAPINNEGIHGLYIDSWNEPVCGLDFSNMKDLAGGNFYLVDVNDRNVLSLQDHILLSFEPMNPHPIVENSATTYNILRPSTVHGIAFWFSCFLAKGEVLSNNLWQHTHWKQCMFLLKEPLKVQRDDLVAALFSVNLKSKDKPFLKVDLVKVLEKQNPLDSTPQ